MEAGRIVGVSSVMVPNRYSVSLSDQDYAAFAPIRASLEQEMARYLARFAHERGYATTAPPEVHIVPDSTLRPRHIVAVGQLTELPPGAAPSTEQVERTALMPRIPVEAPRQGSTTPTVAHLTLGETTYPLVGPDVALGRGLENTIVLEDGRVSRSHARLILTSGHWTVRDEGSTNGTFVNGRMVTQALRQDLRTATRNAARGPGSPPAPVAADPAASSLRLELIDAGQTPLLP